MFKKGTPSTRCVNAYPVWRPSHHYVRNGLALVALALFAAAAALAVVKPTSQPELPAVYQARQNIPVSISFPIASAQPATPFIHETRIRAGDTLAAVLQRLDVNEPKLLSFLIQDKAARSIYKLYPGRTVRASLNDEGQLISLRYLHTPGATENSRFVSKWLEITPAGNDSFNAVEHSQPTDTQVRVAEGKITSSLFGATDAADIPDAITLQMADILGSKIDFMQDLRRDDRFRVIYESHTYDGKEVGSGRVLALEFNNQDKAYDAVWFAPTQGSGSYYDFTGKNLKGAFLRTALEFSRISSTFGMRKHPIHGNWRGHSGVDYAAARGTAIRATADGTVQFIGSQNGYGNTIVLKHGGQITTLYAHQNSFAKGLKQGDSVLQGQLIGYVGSTGWATGPHLHYEFRVNDKPIDPLSIDLPVARTLVAAELKQFERTVATYQQHIHMLADLQNGNIQLASR